MVKMRNAEWGIQSSEYDMMNLGISVMGERHEDRNFIRHPC